MNALTKIQVINGPDGHPAFVVIPYADYVQSQQAGAGAAYAQDKSLIPHEVVELMIMQEMTPIRAWREYLGLTQADLAARIGITQSAYAQQESAPKNRKATREKIAAAMGLSTEQLSV